MKWTKEQIVYKLQNDQKWLERGIIAIYEKQTREEKVEQDSNRKNGVGFNKPDSHKLSYYAQWIQSGKHLNGKHLENARKKMLKYAGQLTDIANNKI